MAVIRGLVSRLTALILIKPTAPLSGDPRGDLLGDPLGDLSLCENLSIAGIDPSRGKKIEVGSWCVLAGP